MKAPRYRVASIIGFGAGTVANNSKPGTFWWVADDWYCGREVTKPTSHVHRARAYCERLCDELNEKHRVHQHACGYDEAGEPLSPAIVGVAV